MFAAVLVLSCNDVQIYGEKFVTTCNILQASLRRSSLRSELQNLAQYSGKLKPIISAGGLYPVNQGVLAGIISVITTYSIIFIQFNTF